MQRGVKRLAGERHRPARPPGARGADRGRLGKTRHRKAARRHRSRPKLQAVQVTGRRRAEPWTGPLQGRASRCDGRGAQPRGELLASSAGRCRGLKGCGRFDSVTFWKRGKRGDGKQAASSTATAVNNAGPRARKPRQQLAGGGRVNAHGVAITSQRLRAPSHQVVCLNLTQRYVRDIAEKPDELPCAPASPEGGPALATGSRNAGAGRASEARPTAWSSTPSRDGGLAGRSRRNGGSAGSLSLPDTGEGWRCPHLPSLIRGVQGPAWGVAPRCQFT